MSNAVIAAFYIDPLPPLVMCGLVPSRRAAVVLLEPVPPPATNGAMIRAVERATGQRVPHIHSMYPAPGVYAMAIFVTGSPAVAAAAMVEALGADATIAHCPTRLIPDEPFGLDRLVERVYQAYLSRLRVSPPEPAWQLVAPAGQLVAA